MVVESAGRVCAEFMEGGTAGSLWILRSSSSMAIKNDAGSEIFDHPVSGVDLVRARMIL